MDVDHQRHSPPRRPDSPSTATETPAPREHGNEAWGGLNQVDDRVLVARASEADEDAFAELVHRHSARLLALAFHMLGSLPDAEEVVQEAFTSAWRHLPGFRGDAAFHTWMYRIVTNRCLNLLHRRPPSVPLDTVAEPSAHDATGEPARSAENSAAAAALSRVLGNLPDDQRVCWILRELHELRYQEIARVVGVREQTVRGRLFRARRTLTEEMAPWR